MDNILEILIPLIFAAIYFFGNMFSGKSDEDSATDTGVGRREEDPDAIERQRRIQEEIRRKIAERRAGEGSRSPLGTPSPSPASRQSQPGSFNADEILRRRQQREQEAHASQERHAVAEQDQGQAATTSYESHMQERLQRIEATEKRAEKLKQQARASRRPQVSSSPAPRSSLARGSARATLQNPAAARAAFIYGEILGQPISLRKTQTIPGLLK